MDTTSIAITRTALQHDRKNTLVWTAQILLAAIFSFAAVAKLAGAHTSVQMFNQMGAGQWLRYFVGTAELAGAIGLLVPRLAGRAAAGLAADMAGASIVNIAVLHSGAVALTVPLCVVCALVARSRWGAARRTDFSVDRLSGLTITWTIGRQFNHGVQGGDVKWGAMWISTVSRLGTTDEVKEIRSCCYTADLLTLVPSKGILPG